MKNYLIYALVLCLFASCTDSYKLKGKEWILSCKSETKVVNHKRVERELYFTKTSKKIVLKFIDDSNVRISLNNDSVKYNANYQLIDKDLIISNGFGKYSISSLNSDQLTLYKFDISNVNMDLLIFMTENNSNWFDDKGVEQWRHMKESRWH